MPCPTPSLRSASVVACDRRARPKSSSFTPSFVSITLPGLRSRCTMPCRCAQSSAAAIGIAIANASSTVNGGTDVGSLVEGGAMVLDARDGPRASRALSVSPSRYYHDDEVDRWAVDARRSIAADVVQHADVRMIERRDRLRLTLESLARGDVGGQSGREHLDRNDAIEPRVAASIHLAHPAGADCIEDFVGAEPAAAGYFCGSTSAA